MQRTLDMQSEPSNKKRTIIRCRGTSSIFIHHHHLHNNWSQLSKVIPHRYNNTLKNNFYSLMRSVVRRILIGDLEKITGLYLLETVYVSSVVVELLQQPEESKYTKGDMPPHIHSLIAKKGIKKEICEEYLKKTVNLFLKKNPERSVLKRLEEYNTLTKLNDLFVQVASQLKTKVRNLPESLTEVEVSNTIEALILETLEKELTPPVYVGNPVFPYANPILSFKSNLYVYPFAPEVLPTILPNLGYNPNSHFNEGLHMPLHSFPSEHNGFATSFYHSHNKQSC